MKVILILIFSFVLTNISYPEKYRDVKKINEDVTYCRYTNLKGKALENYVRALMFIEASYHAKDLTKMMRVSNLKYLVIDYDKTFWVKGYYFAACYGDRILMNPDSTMVDKFINNNLSYSEIQEYASTLVHEFAHIYKHNELKYKFNDKRIDEILNTGKPYEENSVYKLEEIFKGEF